MKKLVAYFSASGTTKQVANNLAKVLGADVFEIVPKQAYTTADLNWMDKKSRSTLEMNNPSARPQIKNQLKNMAEYDVVFLGFPIWWYTAPRIINTFLESYNFENKTIVLFATSGGSGFGETVNHLLPSVSASTKIKEGKILNGNPTETALKSWLNNLRV